MADVTLAYSASDDPDNSAIINQFLLQNVIVDALRTFTSLNVQASQNIFFGTDGRFRTLRT